MIYISTNHKYLIFLLFSIVYNTIKNNYYENIEKIITIILLVSDCKVAIIYFTKAYEGIYSNGSDNYRYLNK